jgi:hypoxanthine phosphoribosyltransferase
MERKLLFDADTIARRVKELGGDISAKHQNEELLVVGVLKGCFVFMADLVRQLTCDCRLDFARIASYGTGTESAGQLDIIMDVRTAVHGKHVLLVDDIVDTGLTLSEYRKHLANQGPASWRLPRSSTRPADERST